MNTTTIIPNRGDIKKTTITFRLSQRQGKRFPGYPINFLVPSESEILWIPEENGIPQPEKAKTRLIRYIPGMPSIFVDEWTDVDKHRQGKKIKFSIGFKNVPTQEKNLLLFLRLSGHNEANNETRMSETSVLYKEEDYEVNSKKAVDQERLTTKAMYFVNENPIEEVKAYAQSLCTNKAQIDVLNGMDEYGIRASLIGLAKTKPETFIKELQAKDTKNKVFIIQAIYKGIIKTNEEGTKLSWAESGDVFVEAPTGVDVITWFAEMTIKNNASASLLDSIKELLNSSNTTIRKNDSVSETKDDNSTWQSKMIDDAIANGTLIKSGMWYKVKGKEDGEFIYSSNGMKNLLSDIADKDSPILDILMNRN